MSDIITITHTKSGSSFGISSFGATVVSYKSASSGGRENLFLSKLAKRDCSKAIRGGIPLVFPIFGPPDQGSTMPQHGFARTNMWKVKPGSQHDADEHAGISLTLDLSDCAAGTRGTNNLWTEEQAARDGTNCRLTLDVKVDATSLTSILVVENTGSDAFNFNCLQHTYFAVDGSAAQNPSECFVEGLQGYSDITDGGKTVPEDAITLTGEVDRVFVHPEGHSTVSVKIGVGGGKTVKMEAFGEVAESPVPVSCVVWNPSVEKAKAMSDFGDEEYKDMICVEPGLLGHQPVLSPGKEARFTQIIFA